MADRNDETAQLVRDGAAAGHGVMVTALGPVWITECPCGGLSRQAASKRQANQHGLEHLRVELSPTQPPCFYCRRGIHDSCISGFKPCSCCASVGRFDV